MHWLTRCLTLLLALSVMTAGDSNIGTIAPQIPKPAILHAPNLDSDTIGKGRKGAKQVKIFGPPKKPGRSVGDR